MPTMTTPIRPGQDNKHKATETMKALVFRGPIPNQIQVENVPVPRAGFGEAVIRVTLTTICGTDLHVVRGEYPVKPGLVLGHEAVGIIHELGAGVTGYNVEDRVLVGAITPCGQCNFCLSGKLSQCGGPLGGWKLGNTINGAQAEFMRTPSPPLWEGNIDWQDGLANMRVRTLHGADLREQTNVNGRQSAIQRMLGTLWSGATAVLTTPAEIDIVGHRVVHGGDKLDQPTLITPEVKDLILGVSSFAPLHNRNELEGIEIVEKLIGRVPQAAVFDTGFHRTLPLSAALYPGPYEWLELGIRRYGFHGINHQYCAQRAAQLVGRDLTSLRLINCHLGNGCSLAAIRGGESVDTTMGFTPVDGLMMGSRSGSVDPGILTYLIRQTATTGEQLDETLNKKSGLLGISGISSDMRQILTAIQNGNQRAKLAFDMFVHRLQSGIGAMAAVLGGVDILVFTAGIGENSPEVRAATCASLGFLGLKLDAEQNAHSPADQEIGSSDSSVGVLIIRAQEDWAIAQACLRLLGEPN